MASLSTKYFIAISVCISLLSGCGSNQSIQGSKQTQTPDTTSAFFRIDHAKYDSNQHSVSLYASPIHDSKEKQERIDIHNTEGLINYATTAYPTERVTRVDVITNHATKAVTVPVPTELAHPIAPPSPTPVITSLSVGQSRVPLPPPGTQIDHSIQPVADLSASVSAKTQAVLSVAISKLGTPYIWGHNEDRGQRGFDCSNFTEYVYHHALGYLTTSFSRKQYTSVGVPIPISQMQPGDLVIFEEGKHVGIYSGNDRVIQEGGGLQKVGYLSIARGSYWGKRITTVKRMY
jgi:cell wall-associated NlpC family hydrolase